ncbi:ketopantoate reductase family protein [Bhargavaea cecembensis]|uniref:ketopantoate reductase family protein n=1 Tax=Bhargavaea cecembensis TaxID=394098 RepID=UPI00058FEF64|nr:2-dehydropantoate 2-reductase [Bhargavaea cecembensis]
MKLNIAGAGAVGLLLASGFARAGFSVRLLVRSSRQAALLRSEGVCLEEGDGRHTFRVDASADPAEWEDGVLTIPAMKSYDLEGFLDSALRFIPDSPLLFVQNGVAHLGLADSLRSPAIAFATVEHGALKRDGRTVRHTGTGPLSLAPAKGNAGLFTPLLSADSPDFPVRLSEDPGELLYRKALKNAVINPVTAVTGARNGELASDPPLRRLAGMIHGELAAAFPDTAAEVPLEAVLELCRKTADNESSMLADLNAGRKTEADAILGGLIREADRRGSRLPLLSGLSEMIAFLERRGSDG